MDGGQDWCKRWTRLQIESRRFTLTPAERRQLWRGEPRAERWLPPTPALDALEPRRALLWAYQELRRRETAGQIGLRGEYSPRGSAWSLTPQVTAVSGVATSLELGFDVGAGDWLAVLRRNNDDDALALAIDRLESFGDAWVPHVAAAVEEVFGADRMMAAACGLVLGDRPARRAGVFRWLGAREQTPSEVLLAGVRDRGSAVRYAAAAGLRRRGPKVAPALLALLADEAAHVREGAAMALRFVGGTAAVAPLRAAAAVETVGFVAAALRRAAHYCDPSTTGPPDEEVVHFGAYDLDDATVASVVLSELRELLNDVDQSVESWVRLCNIIERLRTAGAVEVAQDYLSFYGVEAWSAAWRLAPFEWAEHPGLLAVCARSRQAQPWVTLDALVAGRMTGFLMSFQRRANLVPTEDGRRLFLDAVQAGWSFCREHGLHPSWLRVQVGGAFANERGVREHLELQLFRGFGIRIGSVSGVVQPGAWITAFAVDVPAEHPLQRTHLLGLNRSLALHDLLPSEDRPPPQSAG